jgi:hypothetical protein
MTVADSGPQEPAKGCIFEASRAWDLIEAVANGGSVEAQPGVHSGMFAVLREIAGAEVGNDATDGQRDELAVAMMQRVRQLRGVLAKAFKAPDGRVPLAQFIQDDETALKFAARLHREISSTLRQIGKTGTSIAGRLKSVPSRNALEFWQVYDGPAPALKFLACALWADEVKPLLDRLASNPAALGYNVHEDVVRIHSRAHKLSELNGQQALVFDGAEPIIVIVPAISERVVKLIADGASKLGSVLAHRVLHYEVVTGYDRVMRGEADARRLAVEGGWSGFAELLGINDKRRVDDLKAIVYAQSAIKLGLANGRLADMIALDDQPAVGRRRGKVEIVLGTMLLPHYIYELHGQLSGRELYDAKRLVPIADLPPFVGRPNDHGPQATAAMLVLREMRLRARELHNNGAVQISLERFAELFRQAHLPASLIGRVLDRWTQNGTDGPAFLSRVEGDAYTLSDAHARVRSFLLSAGEVEQRSSEAGARSARARKLAAVSAVPK